MMKHGRTIRIVLNSVLLLAIVALGVTVYQAGTEENREQAQLEEQTLEERENADQQENAEQQENSEQETADSEENPMVDAGTSQVQADMEEEDGTETAQSEESTSVTEEELTQETAQNEAASEMVEMESQDSVDASSQDTGIEVDFTEDSLMAWPLSGELVLDYNMENTVYFPTLNQYRLNPAIAVKSDVGAPVSAAANGIVTAIEESAKTGLTVTMDLGNGYEAVYGQLKDLTVAEGQTVAQGAIIGYVNEPSKYYSVEGSNLYFAMEQDGAPVDPITYLP